MGALATIPAMEALATESAIVTEKQIEVTTRLGEQKAQQDVASAGADVHKGAGSAVRDAARNN